MGGAFSTLQNTTDATMQNTDTVSVTSGIRRRPRSNACMSANSPMHAIADDAIGVPRTSMTASATTASARNRIGTSRGSDSMKATGGSSVAAAHTMIAAVINHKADTLKYPSVMQLPFFAVFGVTWFALCLHASVVNGLFVVAVYALLRLCGASRFEAAAFGALSAFFFYPPTGTPFMDQHSFFFMTLMFLAA